MRCACIDIGSNTTRLLVAEPDGPRLREIVAERAFTHIGLACGPGGSIPPGKVDEVAGVVARQAETAREAGARSLRAVATAAIRRAPNRGLLLDAVRERSGVEVEVLPAHEEARLAFLGATGTCPGGVAGPVDAACADRTVAVVDVGGGSTEIVVGTPRTGVRWTVSVPIGSSVLRLPRREDARLEPGALAEARERARTAFATVVPPAVEQAIAVGGSATSLRRLAGGDLGPAALERALAILAAGTVEEIVAAHGLHPDRVRMLPAALVLLAAVGSTLGDVTLQVGRGGLREGILFEELARPG